METESKTKEHIPHTRTGYEAEPFGQRPVLSQTRPSPMLGRTLHTHPPGSYSTADQIQQLTANYWNGGVPEMRAARW